MCWDVYRCDGSIVTYAIGYVVGGMPHVQMVVDGMLCMLKPLNSMRYILLVVVEFLFCKLDVLQGVRHVLVVDSILYVL